MKWLQKHNKWRKIKGLEKLRIIAVKGKLRKIAVKGKLLHTLSSKENTGQSENQLKLIKPFSLIILREQIWIREID